MNCKRLGIILFFLSALLSCGEGGLQEEVSYCRLKDAGGGALSALEATAEGLSATVKVESGGMWTVQASAEWIGVAPSRGNKYGTFTVNVLPNRAAVSRDGTVTVKADGCDPVLVPVRQKGKEGGGEEDPASSLRFMTFNIRTGGKADGSTDEPGHEWKTVRKPAVLAMFAEIDPDVAVLQECRQEQLNDLEAALPGYVFYRYANDGVLKSGATETCQSNIFQNSGARSVTMVRKGMYSMVQWGRFWLSDTPDVVSTFPETESKKVTLWLRLKELATDREFYVFNIHFVTPGKGDCLAKCAACTVSQIRDITGNTGPDAAGKTVFLAGDFNAIETDSRIAAVPAFMKNARLDAPLSDPSMTYNHFSASASDWKRLDHIFYHGAVPSRHKVVNEAKYGTDFISDHWPVFADFTIR